MDALQIRHPSAFDILFEVIVETDFDEDVRGEHCSREDIEVQCCLKCQQQLSKSVHEVAVHLASPRKLEANALNDRQVNQTLHHRNESHCHERLLCDDRRCEAAVG